MGAPIIEVRRARQRFATSTEWLESRHCFSFGEHYDPANVAHGRLLVSNDDVVLSGTGFDAHPHRDAEILTWVLSGTLVHEDSFGNRGEVYRGLAQRMSAGSGVVHSERNDAFRHDSSRLEGPAHFIQMWLRPDEIGVPPSYMQREFPVAELGRGWLPVASGRDPDAVVSVGAGGSTLWVTVLGPGVVRTLPEAPFVHLYLASGEVDLETVGRMAAGDSVRITGRAPLRITGLFDAEVLLWDMSA